MDKLLKFLFEESQVETHFENLVEELASVQALEVKKQPLAAALKTLGVTSDTLTLSPENCYVLTFLDHNTFAAALNTLTASDGVNKLAELGWVVANGGNDNGPGTMELPEYHIHFLNIGEIEPSDGDADKPEDLEKLQKHLQTTGMAGDVGNLKGEAVEDDLPDPTHTPVNEA